MFFLASIISRFKDFISLRHIEVLMGTWGYPLLFGLLFSCGLGVPLPEDIPLLLAGYFVANGKMHLMYAAISAWLGIIGGDCILYSFGHKYGLGITKVPLIGKHVTTHRIQYAERLFQKYGIWVVAVGRLFAGIRGAMVIAAGTIRFNLAKFLIADGFAAILSGGLFMGLGYWAGKQLGDLEALCEKVGHYEHYVLGGIAVLAALVIAWAWWRKEPTHQPVIDEAMGKVVEKVTTTAPPAAQAAPAPTAPELGAAK